MKYPKKVECRPNKDSGCETSGEGVTTVGQNSGCETSGEGGTSAGQNSGCETSGEGGTSAGQESFPGGMSYVARRRGDRLRVHGRESHVAFFREDPTGR